MKIISMKRIWHMALVCIAIFLAAAAWADDKGPRENAGRRSPIGEEQDKPLDIVRVTIEKKNLEKVTTSIGDKYYLSDNTIIVNTDGQQVSARKMLVPCEAEISYLNENGRRIAERIDIKIVAANATKNMTSDRPE